MGNPMNGDIYEDGLRPGDVDLDEDTARRLKEMIPARRIKDLMQKFREQGARAAGNDDAPSRPMPKYKCHKKVWALEIANIEATRPKPTIAELEEILASEGNKNINISPSGAVLGVTGTI